MRDEWYFLTIGKTLNIDRFVPYVCVSFFYTSVCHVRQIVLP